MASRRLSALPVFTTPSPAIADLLQKQAELGTHLSEKLKARAQEFSTLTAEVQESVGNFAADAANRARGAKKVA